MNVNKFKNILIFRLAEIRRLSFSIYSKSGALGTFFFTKILRIRRNHIFQVEKMRNFRTPFRPSDRNLDDWGMLSGRSEWTHAIGLLLCLQYKYCFVVPTAAHVKTLWIRIFADCYPARLSLKFLVALSLLLAAFLSSSLRAIVTCLFCGFLFHVFLVCDHVGKRKELREEGYVAFHQGWATVSRGKDCKVLEGWEILDQSRGGRSCLSCCSVGVSCCWGMSGLLLFKF